MLVILQIDPYSFKILQLVQASILYNRAQHSNKTNIHRVRQHDDRPTLASFFYVAVF